MNRRKRWTVTFAALFLTGCGQSVVDDVQNQVVADFLDPQSARFTGTDSVEGKLGTYVCGTVNGKNAFGAYTGKQRYWGMNSDGIVTAEIVEDGSETPCEAYRRQNSSDAADKAANAYLDRQFKAAQRELDCSLNKHCVDENGLINSM